MSSNKSKTSKKKSKSAPIDEELNKEEKEKVWLLQEALLLQSNIQKEEHVLEDFNQQLDKIKFYRKVDKGKLLKKKLELAEKKKNIKERHADHEKDLDLYKQKIKHLLFEHQNGISLEVRESEVDLKIQQADYSFENSELKDDAHHLRLKVKEKELSHDEFCKRLKREHNNELAKLRGKYARNSAELITSSDNILNATKESFDCKRKQKISDVERVKDDQINMVIHSNQQELNLLRHEKNASTQENLKTIKELQKKLVVVRKQERQAEKSLNEVILKNHRITKPLEKARYDVENLSGRLKAYQVEKDDLKKSKDILRGWQQKLEDLKWQHEVLFQRYAAVEADCDVYKNKVQSAVSEAHQKGHLRNVLLENKIKSLSKIREQQTATLNELLVRGNFEPAVVSQLQSQLTNVVEHKNKSIEELETSLQRVREAHKALKVEYELILNE